MNKSTRLAYYLELERQAEICVDGYLRLRPLLDQENRPTSSTPKDVAYSWSRKLWAPVQGIVISASVIGYILWPDKGDGHRKRAEELRDELLLADASPFESQAVRNATVHVDREIDRWAASLTDGVDFAPWRAGVTEPTAEEKRTFLRYLDINGPRLWVAGHSCDLFELANEAGHIILPAVGKWIPVPRFEIRDGESRG
jgi:hypothetical protein